MSNEDRRERERQTARQHFLDAARQILITEGLQALTMRRVAQDAEYSTGAVYTHFEDKDALVRELCAHDFAVFTGRLNSVTAIENPRERLLALAQGYAKFAVEYPQHYRLLFMSPRPANYKPEADRGNPERDAYAVLESAVRYAMSHGMFSQFKSKSELIAQTLWAGIHGVVALELVLEKDNYIKLAPLDQRVGLMSVLLLDGLAISKLPAPAPRKAKRARAKRAAAG